MSVRVEWTRASFTDVHLIRPGEEWIGAPHQNPQGYVLTLSTDEVTAIEGSATDLLALANRIERAVECLRDDVARPSPQG